ncbi:FKBP-type peptidyl-prolyl cis-trans isomerase [Acanthopleuribacter pedis]|uniref:Peptidyl-prolyl cis-trans isomerase n=1 Tax=Acanthopleuribacter pedis TaxID=442870 RepID=A0A8J7QC29_9BACT|nr:FKBP-type peptidyl-prolyl cis-trans isomerase [Acanthopleuribacter pedis]MBO1318251.1 FKBP-type peptidyl-prolyl cis-trans isomerase [Acanthopleuribacter pedis]
MSFSLITVLLAVSLFQEPATKPAPAEPAIPDKMKVSYILGQQYGEGLSRDSIDISIEEFVKGFEDGSAGKNKFSQEEIQKVMSELRTYAMAKAQARRQKELSENTVKAEKFLAENQKKDGIQTMENGIQYKVLTQGSGEKPTAESRVKVHYRGRLIDGKEFDSSYKRNKPAEFRLNGVIKGWQESLVEMPVGSKWEVFIPPALGYGERGTPNIPANSLLIFEIELLEIL